MPPQSRVNSITNVRQDSSVGTVTCYRLDSLGVESWWRQNFLHLSRLALGPIVPAIQKVLGQSQGYSSRGIAITTQPHIALR